MVQGGRHARAMRPPGAQRPPAEHQMADVVDHQEPRHRRPAEPQRDPGERESGGEREPARPHEPIAQGSQRTRQRGAQALDLLRGRAVVLRPRRRPDREAGQVGVRIEEVRSPRDRRVIGGPVGPAGQVAQQRLLRHADPQSDHILIGPRALHCEEAQQACAQSRARRHRSQTASAPPPRPTANQRSSGPRPTSRSVPVPAAASAAAAAATATATKPRWESVPAIVARATHATASAPPGTRAARTASRTIPPTWTWTRARGSPCSIRLAAPRTARALSRRSTWRLRPPSIATGSPTSAPRAKPPAPVNRWPALTAATVAGPYSGERAAPTGRTSSW